MSNNILNRDPMERSFGNASEQSDLQPSNTFQRSHLQTNTILSHTSPQQIRQQALNIAYLKFQIKLLTLSEVYNPKILNTVSHAFKNIKQSQLNNTFITKDNKELIMKVTANFVQRVSNVQLKNIKKVLGISFGHIFNFGNQNRNRLASRQQSCVSPYRINSKMQNSERIDSQLEFGQSQGYDKSENVVRENKLLKKKKEKIKGNQNQFLHKMDQLISSHEAFLKKK